MPQKAGVASMKQLAASGEAAAGRGAAGREEAAAAANARAEMEEAFRCMQQRKWTASDRHVTLVFTSLLLAACTYNCSLMWRVAAREGLGGKATLQLLPTLCYIACHMCLELYLTYLIISRSSKLYNSNRSACLICMRLASLLLMLVYVPRTWHFSVPYELAAGKRVALTYRLLLAGVATASSFIEALAFQLPLHIAAPYHTFRAALSLASLPQILAVFSSNPELQQTAAQLWAQLSSVFDSAAMLILGADIPAALGVSSCPCPTSALLLYIHIALGLFVPLHLLGLVQARSWKAFAAQWQQRQQHNQAQSGADAASASTGSSSSSAESAWSGGQPVAAASSAAAGGTGTPTAAAAALPDEGTSSSGGQPAGNAGSLNHSDLSRACSSGTLPASTLPASEELELQDLEFGGWVHSMFMFCVLMLLWALLDAIVTVWGPRIDGLCV